MVLLKVADVMSIPNTCLINLWYNSISYPNIETTSTSAASFFFNFQSLEYDPIKLYKTCRNTEMLSIRFKTSVISDIFSKIINQAQFMNLQNENLNKRYHDCNAKNQDSNNKSQILEEWYN